MCQLHYQIPSADVTWSRVFSEAERLKRVGLIVDYSVSQTSLEQIFLNFSKQQQTEHVIIAPGPANRLSHPSLHRRPLMR